MSKIWVNGCFDVLHVGHIRLFKYAKSIGNYLRVGIDSDERVRLLKGKDRPYNNQNIRVEFLNAISYIDDVVVFGSEEELRYSIQMYSPEVIVVGSEYKFKDVIGKEYSKNVSFFERVEGYSTSFILGGENE